MVTQLELGWFAGIIDGEGSILICKKKQAFKVMEWIESRKINKRNPYSDSELKLRTDVMTLNARGSNASEN